MVIIPEDQKFCHNHRGVLSVRKMVEEYQTNFKRFVDYSELLHSETKNPFINYDYIAAMQRDYCKLINTQSQWLRENYGVNV